MLSRLYTQDGGQAPLFTLKTGNLCSKSQRRAPSVLSSRLCSFKAGCRS